MSQKAKVWGIAYECCICRDSYYIGTDRVCETCFNRMSGEKTCGICNEKYNTLGILCKKCNSLYNKPS